MGRGLVGRDRELAQLSQSLAAVLDGQPRVVVCRGEPGIGKTRLAEEFAVRAGNAGAVCAWGCATDALGAPPLWPWHQALTSLAGVIDVAAAIRDHGLVEDLGALVPDGLKSPSERLAEALPTPEARFRQFAAVARLLREAARARPLVIILEDLHWADAPTLLLLRYLTRSLLHDRLLILCNSRSTEDRQPEIATALAGEPAAVVIDLGGLTPTAVGRQLSDLLADDVDDSTAAHVHSLTAGNPLFVREVGRAMVDARAGRPFSLVTRTVLDAISQRVARLSADCAVLLRTAAVVGAEFEVPLVAAASGITGGRALELVSEALAAGLVEEWPAVPRFRFVHALVRDAIEAGLRPDEAARIHRAVARGIEQLYGSEIGDRVYELARHSAYGALDGDVEGALRWISLAGHEAMRELAYEEAARLFRQALVVGGAALSGEERCRLTLAAGRALQLAGDLAASTDACVEAFRMARSLGRPDLAAETALALEPTGTQRFVLTTRRLCEEALHTIDPAAKASRAKVLARFVQTFTFMRHDEDVEAASREAVALAEESGDPDALVAALRARQVLCVDPGGLEERAALADRLLSFGLQQHNPQLQLVAHLWRIDVALERGALGDVTHEIDALVTCRHQVRGPIAAFEVARCRAVLAQAQGRFSDARRHEAEAFAVLAPTDHDVHLTFRSALLMNVAHHTGFFPEVLDSFTYGGAADGHAEMLGFIGQVAAAQALVLAGRLDEARNLYLGLGPVASWDPPKHVVLCGQVLGLGAALALGESRDVALLRERLSAFRGHHIASGMSAVVYLGPVELWLGVAARHLGLLDDAVADLESAAAACTANGAAGFRTEAQYELVNALASRRRPGDTERARRLLAAVESSATQLGMARITAGIDRLRARLDRSERTTPLTRRERQVAALVAQGMTNRDIAARLVVAERTAESHVQHILTKLGLSSRSQIAVWAITEIGTESP